MTSTNSQLPILIIGGGPSGLTAALALAKNNVPLRIIDKAPEFHKMSRGAGQHARTLEIFQSLGVVDELMSRGAISKPMRAYKLPGGTEVARTWSLHEPMPETPDRPYQGTAVSQYITEGVLRDHLAAHDIHVELGTEPTSIEQSVDSVTVYLKKTGQDGQETSEVVNAAYVVGADGARGMTRKSIGATFEGETRDADGMAWTDCELEGITNEFWHIWSQPGKFTIAARPKAEGGYHMGIACSDFDPVDLVDPAKFVQFFRENTGRNDIVFKNMATPTHWKPNMRMVNKFSEGRVFIVGDAAHVHSPTGGQGLNTSVQDSYNLAWKLALAHKGLAAPSLLATYNTERLPVVAQMLATTTKLYTHAIARTDGGAKLKEAAEVAERDPSKDQSGFLMWRNRALALLEVNYRFSPLALDIRGDEGRTEDEMRSLAYVGYGPEGGVWAGDRAPEAPGLVDADGHETSLFRIFKPQVHTIMVFTLSDGVEGENAVEVVKAAQTYPSGTVQVMILGRAGVPTAAGTAGRYHDRDGHAFGAYRIEDGAPKVIVIRPDGYVGAFVRNAEEVQEYFTRVYNL